MTSHPTTTIETTTISPGENVPSIESLSTEASRIAASLGWWNSANLIGIAAAAIAATFLVLTSAAMVRQSRALKSAEDKLAAAREQQLQRDLKAKDAEIAAA